MTEKRWLSPDEFEEEFGMSKSTQAKYRMDRKLPYVKFGGFVKQIDELFEAITLIQTKKIAKFPIVLVGKNYWSGLFEWVEKTMYDKEKNISKNDMNIYKIVDTSDEAVEVIDEFYSKYVMKPNF